MLSIALDHGLSITELPPTQFASICWEAHNVVRPQLALCFKKMFSNERGKLLAVFDANGMCCGRIEVEINPAYQTRGRSCATFGWFDANSFEIAKILLNEAAKWASRQQVNIHGKLRRNTLLRGPISFPKIYGGMGCQVEGFEEHRLAGVSTNRPEMADWITSARFFADTPYACVYIGDTPVWLSAPDEINGVTLVTLTADEWMERADEVASIAEGVFTSFLPDFTVGRFKECFEATVQFSQKFVTWPCAIDSAGQLVGLIVTYPNVWELWDGRAVETLNGDTVIITPEYQRLGLFSALHNKGFVDTREHLGIWQCESTYLWSANEKVIQSLFQHGRICRRHVVFQKFLKKN